DGLAALPARDGLLPDADPRGELRLADPDLLAPHAKGLGEGGHATVMPRRTIFEPVLGSTRRSRRARGCHRRRNAYGYSPKALESTALRPPRSRIVGTPSP